MEKTLTSKNHEVLLRELKALRLRKGLTQIDLSQRLQKPQAFISKCEQGGRRLDLLELMAWCEALNTPIIEFIQIFQKHLEKQQD